MRWSTIHIFSFLWSYHLGATDLIGIPTVPFERDHPEADFSIRQVSTIIIDSRYSTTVDTEGPTLIPPTLLQFAELFATDLSSYTYSDVQLEQGEHSDPNAIFLTIGDPKEYLDVAGRPTSEGYTLTVSKDQGITITGASPLGVWWGTRTVLQQAALNDGAIPTGSGLDSPGWRERGVMLDIARHFYPKEFVMEMCSMLSFYKQNTFHLHLSDNLVNNPQRYSREDQLALYAAFRPWSDDPTVTGLNVRRNESYTREEFDEIQTKCAARGVTIVPEIEAPGHALVISQWRPELGIDGNWDLLNVSNPNTIPTMETIWSSFLPWFHSKVVHIGADEYRDPFLDENALVTQYDTFVNSMNEFITQRTGGRQNIRIWGTFPPRKGGKQDKSISIQHWATWEANPFPDFIQEGYNVLNSDDRMYIVGKYSGSYPQTLNVSRIFSGAPGGAPYAPNTFWIDRPEFNPPRDHPQVQGHIAAQWNDWGPNATTVLEAWHSWRSSLSGLADKQWGGNLNLDQYNEVFEKLLSAVPGQNLDRNIPSKSSTIVEYDFTTGLADLSGNGYDAQTTCEQTGEGVRVTAECHLRTPLGSKGKDFTLKFSVKRTSSSHGTLLRGPDSSLLSGVGTNPNVLVMSGGEPYTLEYVLPDSEFVDLEFIGKDGRSYLRAGGGEPREFRTILGLRGEGFIEREIRFEAPLSELGGDGFEGVFSRFNLVDMALI